MKTVELSASKRVNIGSKEARASRREGKVPAALYGGAENHNIEVNEVAFTKLINTHEVFFIDLDIDGNKIKSLIRDVQFHPVSDRVSHVDFIEVADDREVKFSIPVRLTGQSRGVLNGGKLRHVMRYLRVQGLPSALVDHVEIDITRLKIGDSVKVGDLNLAGLQILEAPNAVVVAVKTARVVVLDEEEDEEVDLESMSDEEREAYEKAQAEKADGDGGGEAKAEGGDGGGDEAKADDGGGEGGE